MKLFDKVRDNLKARASLAHDRTGADSDREIQAATAILLLEAAMGDTEYRWREHRSLVRGLERDFGLGKREILELLDEANEIRPPVVQLADVTALIRDRFDNLQRQEIVKLLWRVIEADGVVDEWEEAFADHVAKAVGISRAEASALRGKAPRL